MDVVYPDRGGIDTADVAAAAVAERTLTLPGSSSIAGKGVRAEASGNHALSLVRIEQGRLWGVVHIWTEFQPIAGSGYAAFKPCERTDLVFKAVASNLEHGAQDCWLVNHNMMGENRTNATDLHIQQGYGFMDARGYTKIVDRKKDMILVSGFNVYPNEIEEVAAMHPGIL